jgi:hypothetical protein
MASLAVGASWLLGQIVGNVPSRPHAANVQNTSDVIDFNLCYAWESIPLNVKLAFLATVASLFILLVQGLRNRAAPVWAAAILLASIPIVISHQLYFWTHCLTVWGQAAVWLLAATAVGAGVLHIQRRLQK